jgi:PPK2 family polyphosphate:nucleotide phosphotransferase
MKKHDFVVPRGKKISLDDYPTDLTGGFKDKAEAATQLEKDLEQLKEYQSRLYAQNTHALLIILQGMDASGKDGTIKNVMSGVNPIGCDVTSFKAPSDEELDHDYFWRHVKRLPERGRIGIFNRSYYEEVLVVRVHPELLDHEKIQASKKKGSIWKERFEQMNQFEKTLVENGTEILKFFLHISKEEQKNRFLKRIEDPIANWKFTDADVKERAFWNDYKKAYEEMLENTSTEHAPWHVIPADRKWFRNVAISEIINQKLESMDLQYPKLKGQRKEVVEKARRLLEQEET